MSLPVHTTIMSTKINPHAEVSPNAVIGTNVSIGPFAIIEGGAVIGDSTDIGGNAYIGTGARIGKECRIHHGAIIGHQPQDLKYADEPTTCEIGDRTIVREYATLHRGTGDGGRTIIGSDCFIMGYVHIAHDCVIGNHVILANAVMMAGHCIIEDYANIGGITPIHQFVHIGQHCMVGGGSRVRKDVPPYILAGSEPLIYEGLNVVGLRRRGFPSSVIESLDNAYTLIYSSKLNVSQAVGKIKEDPALMSVVEVQSVLSFISQSERGIISGRRQPH
jgi:UDP-N-acetylglucosamine acyltransferase